jgi:plastocyanin
MRALIAFLVAAAAFGEAYAADLTVRVVSPDGAPIENAVVTFTPTGGASGPIRFSWPYQVSQRNLQFEPYVLIVPVGAEVRFPNLDRVRHHVYSLSQANRFELELFGRDESRSHRFSQVGIAAIGCNIHDQMQAYIVVVDTPHVGRTNVGGSTLLANVRGAGELRVWHPQLRARGGAMTRAVTLAATGSAQEHFQVQLRSTGAHAH